MRDVTNAQDNTSLVSVPDFETEIHDVPWPQASHKENAPQSENVSRKMKMKNWVEKLHRLLDDVDESTWVERMSKHRDEMVSRRHPGRALDIVTEYTVRRIIY